MNILEGCAFVRHISKGRYAWKGFDSNEIDNFQGKGRKKETTLRYLAGCVKSSLVEGQDFIDFKDICNHINAENISTDINPVSVKRRVYECCKVLKVLGLVEKQGQNYRWIGSPRPLLACRIPEKYLTNTKARTR
jgi:hypothetical protein